MDPPFQFHSFFPGRWEWSHVSRKYFQKTTDNLILLFSVVNGRSGTNVILTPCSAPQRSSMKVCPAVYLTPIQQKLIFVKLSHHTLGFGWRRIRGGDRVVFILFYLTLSAPQPMRLSRKQTYCR